MNTISRKAFTMVELIFVIVIIGILAAVAIPKLGSTADLAYMAKGQSTLATVRSAISTERQKMILRSEFTDVSIYNASGRVFTRFTDDNGSRILDNDIASCTDIGCWNTSDGVSYTFYREATPDCTYKLEDNRFVDITTGGCTEIED